MGWRTSSYSGSNGDCVEVASWRTSSYSIGGGECVEVAAPAGLAVLVRDSADPGGPVLALTAEAWQALVRRVKTADDT